MIHGTRTILKFLFRLAAWTIAILILLLVTVILLIKVPAVQNKIISEAIVYFHKRTQATLEIKEIRFTFPANIYVNGLLLEDLTSDTLLYADRLDINVNVPDLIRKKIHLNNFSASGLTANVKRIESDTLFNYSFLLTAFSDTVKRPVNEPPSSFELAIDAIELRNSKLIFDDNYNGLTAIAAFITDLKTDNFSVSTGSRKVAITSFYLSHSGVIISDHSPADTLKRDHEKSPWQVLVKSIQLDDNMFSLDDPLKFGTGKTFDPEHIHVQHISLKAGDAYYSADKTNVKINSLAAADSSNFAIRHLEVNFLMTPNSIKADRLKLETAYSSLNTSAEIKFSSLALLEDSIGLTKVQADIKESRICAKDILYFKQRFVSLPFFNNETNTATVSCTISGSIKDLKGENILVRSGSKTKLAGSVSIQGLPDPNAATFNIPALSLNTGRKDLDKILGKSFISPALRTPENINVQGHFKGSFNAFQSGIKLICDYGTALADLEIDKNENFISTLHSEHFDLGKLLNNPKMYGPVTINAKATGHGTNKQNLQAALVVDAPEVFLNGYSYQQLLVKGNMTSHSFEGNIDLNDRNAVFNFSGLVDLDSANQKYKFKMDVKGIDLKKINVIQNDLRITFMAVSDLEGHDINTINGKAGITNALVVHDGKNYVLDSILLASVNEKEKSELNFTSAIVGIKYNGTFAPADTWKELQKHINNYFPIAGVNKNSSPANRPQHFNFEIQLHNHPILSEVFFPDLKEFEPGIISGNFDSEKRSLNITASINRVQYGSFAVNELEFTTDSDPKALNYKLSCTEISDSQFKLENLSIDGTLADNKASVNINSTDDRKNKKIALPAQVTKLDENYKLTIDSNGFYLSNARWTASPDNYILFGKDGYLFHQFSFQNDQSKISIESVNNKFKDDIHASLDNFKLSDLSHIVEKDTDLFQGTLQGDILLKRINDTWGITADASINDLTVKKVPVGDLSLKALNPTAQKFDIQLLLSGGNNDLSAKGYYLPKDSTGEFSADIAINSLSAKTIEAFSFGKLKETEGNVKGHFTLTGNVQRPGLTGDLLFDNVFVNPTILNSRIQLKDQSIIVQNNNFHFNSFTIYDKYQNTAVINGSIVTEDFTGYTFSLNVNTDNFLLMNTTEKDDPEFYGLLFMGSKINIKGTPDLPVISSTIQLQEGSNVTFAVPETKLTVDRGENVVEFEDSVKLNPILTRKKTNEKRNSSYKNMDLSSTIQVDKKATLRLLLDPGSSDSLVVRGNAALDFTLDPSGKASLTGTYDLNDGSYLVSLENVVRKKFKIESGSTITWNGDPLDADININAVYSIRAAPIDLVAEQLSGLSETDKGAYRQRYPFLIYLKLKGALLKPEINFEIQLPPEDKGIMGGAVNARLIQLNEDPSSLNKQVFGLLVLNRFIQEDPLQTETNSTATAARTTVGKILSAELNQLGSKIIPGVELNFDVESYDDYTTGSAQGRTEIEVGVKKQLLNDRLSIQVGGSVDVEGEKAKENSASDIAGDVNMEYSLTKDGRYRLKGFRHNEQQEVIEGRIVETGAGILYIKDFEMWKDFFKRSVNRQRTNNTTSFGPANDK